VAKTEKEEILLPALAVKVGRIAITAITAITAKRQKTFLGMVYPQIIFHVFYKAG